MGSELRLDLHKVIPDDPNLCREWNALVLQVDQPQVFYTYEWAQAACRSYSGTLLPLLFLAYDGDSLRGVAALATDKSQQTASFLCATTGDYCDFLSPADSRAAFVDAVLGELAGMGIRSVRLTNLPADSPSVWAIRQGAGANHLHCHVRTAYVCAQVALSALERRGEHNPVLPRKKMLRRFLNAMGREHPVRLDHSRSWETIAPVLPEFMLSHVARFLVTGRISNMARPERRFFLAELAKQFSESGSVVLTRMMSGERVFAWNYGFQFQGAWFWYQPTFDGDLEKYSPGFCLLAKVIEEASENPAIQVVDLGLGAEEYKDRFANQSRRTLYFSLKRSLLAHYGEVLRDRMSAAVRSSPKLEAAIRSTIAKVGRWRRQWTKLRAKELIPSLWSAREISYYEWCGSSHHDGFHIEPLTLNHLASAAIEYVSEAGTLDYLLNATRTMRAHQAEGFVLMSDEAKPLHFAWLGPFDGPGQLQRRGESSSASSARVLITNCWTPVALRGKGYCARALEMIAMEAARREQRPWGRAPSSDVAGIRALERAGFQKRFVVRRHWLSGTKTIAEAAATHDEISTKEVSATRV